MTDKDPRHAAAFCRTIDVNTIGEAGHRVAVEANQAERAALSALIGLRGLERLEAEFKLVRDGRTGVAVTGDVRARVRRACVVTLEDFDADVVEPVEVHFLPSREVEAMAARLAANTAPTEVDADEPDLPDPIVNGRIDLGALATEFLVLGLDPYPKKPGAAFVEPVQEAVIISPFAALARLKDKDGA